MEITNDEKLRYAKVAYEGYLKVSGGKSLVSGARLPDFEQLSDVIKEGWAQAAIETIESAAEFIQKELKGALDETMTEALQILPKIVADELNKQMEAIFGLASGALTPNIIELVKTKMMEAFQGGGIPQEEPATPFDVPLDPPKPGGDGA